MDAVALPLVARDEELEVVRAHMRVGECVVMAGAAGVGKTRLLRELADETERRNIPVRWLAATESSRTIPFGALASLLPAVPSSSRGQAHPTKLVRALLDGFDPDAGPVLVAVDDAHLLDPASATAVHQLAGLDHVALAVTVRSGERCPAAVTALWKDGVGVRLEVLPLSQSGSDELVEAALGGPCSALTRTRLWELSAGSPLYLRELIDGGRANGTLTFVGDRWRLDGSGLSVSTRLGELIRGRLERLGPAGMRVAEVVSVGNPVALAVLEQLSDLAEISIVERAGVIELRRAGQRAVAEMSHPMYGEVVRAQLPVARQIEILRQLADALSATGLRRRDDLLRYATWRLDAGSAPDADTLVDAAWLAAAAFDTNLAARLARAAARVDPRHHGATVALADALYRAGRHEEALDALASARPPNDHRAVEISIIGAKALWSIHRLDEAEQRLTDTGATITDPNAAAWLQGFRAMLRNVSGHPLDAIALAEPLTLNGAIGPRALLSGLSSLALASAFNGQAGATEAAARRGRDPNLLAHIDSHTLLSWIEPSRWVAAWLAGDVETAWALANDYRETGLRCGSSEMVASGSMGQGWAALLRGDVRAARALLGEAVATAPPDDRLGVTCLAQIGLSWLHGWCAELEAAEAERHRAQQSAQSGIHWFDPLIDIAMAWIATGRGDITAARRVLHDTAEGAEQRGQLPYAVLAWHLDARLKPSEEAARRLGRLASNVDGPYAPLAEHHAAALVAGNPAALTAASRSFEQLGMLPLAAEVSAAAVLAHHRHGDAAAAEVQRLRLNELGRRCPGVRLPTMRSLAVQRILTDREIEIAQLAVAGRSSREIAKLLYLSMRTVDSHLGHVYTKLGIAGRHELPAALADHESVGGYR